MKQFITLVPINFNDGTPVPAETLESIKWLFWETFGGATIEGPLEGHWVDPKSGKHYQDSLLRVTVVAGAEKLEEAREIARQICRTLDQEAIYFEARPADGVEFLEG
ncbi:MAG: hypothetical protein CMJ46_16165 [Planctomyces sp.]|nr:hypothetical protein [Planctomyces sp.]